MTEEETVQSLVESRRVDSQDALRTKGDVTPTRRLSRYGPVILWAALIFLFSSGLFSGSNTSTIVRPLVQWVYPSISEGGLALVHWLIRKAGHFGEFAILALLLARAFRTSSREFLSTHWFAVSLIFIVVYALSDELHQSFVSSRTASIYDCLIDAAGGLAALILLRARRRRVSTGTTRTVSI